MDQELIFLSHLTKLQLKKNQLNEYINHLEYKIKNLKHQSWMSFNDIFY